MDHRARALLVWSGLTRVVAALERQSYFQDTWWNIFWFVAEACLLSSGGPLAVHPWKSVLCGTSSIFSGRPLLSPIYCPGRRRGGCQKPQRDPSFCRAVFGTSVDFLHHHCSCSSTPPPIPRTPTALYSPVTSTLTLYLPQLIGRVLTFYETLGPRMSFIN